MRIVIYGAGAIGSLIGGLLAADGQDVLLVARKDHADAIRKKGLDILSKSGNQNVRVTAQTDVEKPKAQDIVFLTVKSHDTAKAVLDLRQKGWQDVPLFCFQNGVRNEELASRDMNKVYGGMVYISAQFLEPGKVIHAGNNLLAFGKYPNGMDEICETVHDILKKRFQAVISRDIMALKWSKLLRNLNNATLAIIGLTYEKAHADEEAREFMAAVVEEGLRAVHKAGIKLGDVDRMTAAKDRTPKKPTNIDSYPSTWQDLKLGRGKQEADYFNGEIVRLGQRLGIKTPLNSLLLRTVSDMTEKKEKPGKYSLRELKLLQ